MKEAAASNDDIVNNVVVSISYLPLRFVENFETLILVLLSCIFLSLLFSSQTFCYELQIKLSPFFLELGELTREIGLMRKIKKTLAIICFRNWLEATHRILMNNCVQEDQKL